MTIIQLSEKRKKWVDANRENGFDDGIKKLLTDLYPDNAHFIYELLQNAEDAGATQVTFILNEDNIEFEHNGNRLFSLADVDSITSIGVSTKKDDPTSIGKFGVGFKAVFAYTNTPEIQSGEYHFRIRDLVIPEMITPIIPSLGEKRTRFIFPFDNPKKSIENARLEIERNLRQLDENTLLFLSNIEKIEYLLPDSTMGCLRRGNNKEYRTEIIVQPPGTNEEMSFFFLRFEKMVHVHDDEGREKSCKIAVAFSVAENRQQNREESDNQKPNKIAPRWGIKPLKSGRVFIYFPAEKESSQLHFHIHAPFASTVARDSVRNCGPNDVLRDNIADLIAESLPIIRDMGMLNINFLAVLPIPTDNLSPFYEPIRLKIVDTFQETPITPTKQGGHTEAQNLFRGPVKISEVIDDEDLSLLTTYRPPLWVANPPPQSQREDRFLDSLDIDSWEWADLTSILHRPYQSSYQYLTSTEIVEHQHIIENWIAGKNDTWVMRFYALLGEASHEQYRTVAVDNIRLIRTEINGGVTHVLPKEAFFYPVDITNLPSDIHFVKESVYNVGRSEERKKLAKSYLEKIGVRPFDENVITELKLENYDSYEGKVLDHCKDLLQFMAYWKKNPEDNGVFKDRPILLSDSQDGKYHLRKPGDVFVDDPYRPTGLRDVAQIHGKKAVWAGYTKLLNKSQLIDFPAFLDFVGVMHQLTVEYTTTRNNVHSQDLRQDYNRRGVKWTSTAINEDYSITNILQYLKEQSIPASRLLWNALIRADKKCAKARFRPNQTYPVREAESQLVHYLKSYAWIPDVNNNYLRPQEITKDVLRADFPFDNHNGLLSAIGFGENAEKATEEYAIQNAHAKILRFDSADEAGKMAAIAELLRTQGISPDELIKKLTVQSKDDDPEFRDESDINVERRRERLSEQFEVASDKDYEIRERRYRMSRETIDPTQWLRNKYTDGTGRMPCQICKKEMPFKKRNGEYYFETVEALTKEYFPKEHEAQFLALCPLCAAMYREFVKLDEIAVKDIYRKLINAENPEVLLKLGNKDTSIRFVESHFTDLKTILMNVDKKVP